MMDETSLIEAVDYPSTVSGYLHHSGKWLRQHGGLLRRPFPTKQFRGFANFTAVL
jgi:hypothetical protein